MGIAKSVFVDEQIEGGGERIWGVFLRFDSFFGFYDEGIVMMNEDGTGCL